MLMWFQKHQLYEPIHNAAVWNRRLIMPKHQVQHCSPRSTLLQYVSSLFAESWKKLIELLKLYILGEQNLQSKNVMYFEKLRLTQRSTKPPTPPKCACRVIIGNQTSHVLEAPRKPPSEMLSKHTFRTCQFYGRLPKECTFQTVILLSVRGNSPHCTAFTSVRSNTKFRKTKWKKILFSDHVKRSTHATTQYATMSTFLSSFAPMTSHDPINSILVTYNKKNAMQQPAIFPALVVTTRLITYLNCRPPAVTSTMISYLKQLHSQKRSFPPKRMLKQPNVTQQWKALPWTTTLSVPNGIAFCCDSWITFVRVLTTRTRSIHIDEPNQKQLFVPKPKRTMQEQNDVNNILW